MKIASFLIGAAVGGTVALLYAPKTGDDTRNLISDKVGEGRRFAERRAQDIRDRANKAVAAGKKAVNRHVQAATDAGEVASEIYQNEIKTAL